MREAPIRKSCAAGSAASSSARASACVLASGKMRRPNSVPARVISPAHAAFSRVAPSRQVTISLSTGVAPVAPAGWRVANSNMRAGEAPADGEPPAVTRAQTSVLSRRSSAEMCPSSSAWKTHWRVKFRRFRANTASVTSSRVAVAASLAPKISPWRR